VTDWAKRAKNEFALKSVSIDRLASFSEFDEEPGEGLLRSLIEMYLDAGPKALETLKTHINAKNIPASHKAAHALKSSSANIGASQLAKMLQELEDATDQEAVSASIHFAKALVDIETEFRRVCQELSVVQDLVQGKRAS